MDKISFKPGNMLYPLPVVMVSCGLDKPNIITIAWTGTINTNPPMVSISVKKERYSYNLIKEAGEFVINIPDSSLVFETDLCGVKSGKDIDKFQECKLTPFVMEGLNTVGIKECKVNIGCKVKEIKELGSHTMFIAEVVSVLVDGSYMNENNRFCFENINPICYSHGEYYELGKKVGKFGFSVKKVK